MQAAVTNVVAAMATFALMAATIVRVEAAVSIPIPLEGGKGLGGIRLTGVLQTWAGRSPLPVKRDREVERITPETYRHRIDPMPDPPLYSVHGCERFNLQNPFRRGDDAQG